MSDSKTEPATGGPAAAPETTRDAFLGGRLSLLQPESGPRAGIDAIFLAAAVPARPGRAERILEAGMGHGVASLALAARVQDAQVTGIEIQPFLAALARDNARANALADRVDVVEADIAAPMARLAALGLQVEGYAHVAANPPFHAEARTRAAADAAKARAHAGADDALARWIKAMTALAAPKATVTLIHRADALGQLLACLDRRFGALVVFPLFPRADAAASRVIVQGIKGSRAPLALAPGLVLHDATGAFTPAAERVLRHGESLALSA